MYKVLFTKRVLKDLEGLDKEVKKRIILKLKEYAQDPLKYARKLVNPKIGTYRFRVGSYRIVFDIDAENLIVLRIGHRKSIYA